MAPRKFDLAKARQASFGMLGGQVRAANLTKAERVAIATKAGQASGGWPKGKKRGPSPLKGRKVTR